MPVPKNALHLVCFLLIGLNTLHAQEFSARASVEKDTYIIGDSIGVLAELDFPAGHIYKLEKIPRLQGLEWLDSSVLSKQSDSEEKIFTITGFDSGSFTFPSLDFVFMNEEGIITRKASTQPFSINIKLADVDTTKDIMPIKAPMQVDYKPFPYWILILTAVLLALGYFIYRRWKKKPAAAEKIILPKQEPIKNISYADEAIQQIASLQQQKLGEQQLYWLGLKEIMRNYISKQYKIATKEKTSAQLIADLKKQELPENISLVEKIFQASDLVLFAKTPTSEDEKIAAAQQAVSFIKQGKH